MKNNKIVIGCDHAAYELKLKVIMHLQEKGYDVIDVGTHSSESCNYPDYAQAVCKTIQSGTCELGILICGTGIGMSLVANKHRGIRAAVCSDTFSARLTREHNNANVLCFGARVVGMGLAFDLVDNFVDTPFSGEERHVKRIELMDEIAAREAKDL